MDRLQASDIERSRSELADLERRFLERVAMTNRCKTGGEIGTGTFVRRYTPIVKHMLTPTVTIMIGLYFQRFRNVAFVSFYRVGSACGNDYRCKTGGEMGTGTYIRRYTQRSTHRADLFLFLFRQPFFIWDVASVLYRALSGYYEASGKTGRVLFVTYPD